MAKDWADEIFSGFIGVLAAIGVMLFARYHNRKREKLELHKLYLETINEMEAHKKLKIAEMTEAAKQHEETLAENTLRYKENIDLLFKQIKQQGDKIIEQGRVIMEQERSIIDLSKSLEDFKKQVNGNH